jgi:hypothetical protein
MYRGQKAQDHENFEADTPMADNRRADYRRRAGVDRTRDFYRGRAHFWCASLRTGHLPDENIILEGHAFGVGAEKARATATTSSTSPTGPPHDRISPKVIFWSCFTGVS